MAGRENSIEAPMARFCLAWTGIRCAQERRVQKVSASHRENGRYAAGNAELAQRFG
jgi:hypothetical protein